MKISRAWLQTFFDELLPDAQTIADALTFHAFEIESVDTSTSLSAGGDAILDVKVTPNRGHDCLSHRGIAKELAAILNVPLANDPLRLRLNLNPTTDAVSVAIESPLCTRYIAGYIRGVKVGPSPHWLKERLESIGQKSINNVVDATNYAMFNIGQPLHAFDASKLKTENGKWNISVRSARKGEKMLALDDKEYTLKPNNLVIVDGNADTVIGIAGVKGGKPSSVDEKTTDIILESANFDGASVRKTAAALRLRTDASDRFQQVIAPEMAAYGIRAAAELIQKVASGDLVGFTDEYPSPTQVAPVTVSMRFINNVLGTTLSGTEVENVFKRLGFEYVYQGDALITEVPFERLDLETSEDLVEEVGRIVGYDKVPTAELPPFPKKPEVNANFYAAERAREELVAQGYSEVFTSVFAERGERVVANKVDGVRPYLRKSLTPGLQDALERNTRNKDLLGLKEVKLFEIGTVWSGGSEKIMLGTAEAGKVSEATLESVNAVEYENLPISSTERYQPFSKYPFIVRDIALWVPTGTEPDAILKVIRSPVGNLLVRSEKFDEFKKSDKQSFAFRLVFQSFEKTLTDAEVNAVMEKVNAAVAKKGWQVR